MKDPGRELIEAVAALDESACTELIRRAEPLIRGAMAGRWFESEADREEVVQDIRVQLLKSVERWDRTRSRFSTWVYGVVRNVHNSHLRERRRRPDELLFSAMGDGFDPPNLEGGTEADAPASDLAQAFRRVYDQMSQDDRTVIDHMLRHGDGVAGHADLGDSLGCSVAAAKQRVYRMNGRLKEAIEAALCSERDLASNKQREQK